MNEWKRYTMDKCLLVHLKRALVEMGIHVCKGYVSAILLLCTVYCIICRWSACQAAVASGLQILSTHPPLHLMLAKCGGIKALCRWQHWWHVDCSYIDRSSSVTINWYDDKCDYYLMFTGYM